MTEVITNTVKVGDIYSHQEAHGISTEVWVYGVTPGYERSGKLVEALLTVQHNGKVIAMSVDSIKASDLDGMELIDYQLVEEVPEVFDTIGVAVA